MTFTLCLITSLFFITILSLPLFSKSKNKIPWTFITNNKESLVNLKNDILNQYKKDELCFAKELLSKAEWGQRKQFLTERYIEVSEKIDWIKEHESPKT